MCFTLVGLSMHHLMFECYFFVSAQNLLKHVFCKKCKIAYSSLYKIDTGQGKKIDELLNAQM